MGYGTRQDETGQEIETYWPDSDENVMYLAYPVPLDDIISIVEGNFGDDYSDVEIGVERIRTDHVDSDLHDDTYYTLFTVIRRREREDYASTNSK
jgi:hypothetical protein